MIYEEALKLTRKAIEHKQDDNELEINETNFSADTLAISKERWMQKLESVNLTENFRKTDRV